MVRIRRGPTPGRRIAICLPGEASGRDIRKDAPGYRHRDTGALNNVGNNGYSWSSAVSGTNGMNLNFNVTWLNPSNANNRGYGFQLRCLSAFTRTSVRF